MSGANTRPDGANSRSDRDYLLPALEAGALLHTLETQIRRARRITLRLQQQNEHLAIAICKKMCHACHVCKVHNGNKKQRRPKPVKSTQGGEQSLSEEEFDFTPGTFKRQYKRSLQHIALCVDKLQKCRKNAGTAFRNQKKRQRKLDDLKKPCTCQPLDDMANTRIPKTRNSALQLHGPCTKPNGRQERRIPKKRRLTKTHEQLRPKADAHSKITAMTVDFDACRDQIGCSEFHTPQPRPGRHAKSLPPPNRSHPVDGPSTGSHSPRGAARHISVTSKGEVGRLGSSTGAHHGPCNTSHPDNPGMPCEDVPATNGDDTAGEPINELGAIIQGYLNECDS